MQRIFWCLRINSRILCNRVRINMWELQGHSVPCQQSAIATQLHGSVSAQTWTSGISFYQTSMAQTTEQMPLRTSDRPRQRVDRWGAVSRWLSPQQQHLLNPGPLTSRRESFKRACMVCILHCARPLPTVGILLV